MYINNLRKTLNQVDESNLKKFESLAFSYHVNVLHNSKLRRADFRIQLRNFMDGKTSSISHHNLDSYLYALDQLELNGATNAFYLKNKKTKTWRELFLKITSDLPLPKEINPSHLNENNMKVLKSILQNLLRFCSDKDEELTRKNLWLVDEIIKIAVSKQKNKNPFL
ncbi:MULTISPECIES: hypothetical protein [Parageobacillus]|uniref:Uncharacterized protein n=1 Tax=Parageobacillus galactosidasius TaxID=883812 RepID=A0A226QPH1_9BACL|nr:MULTISPECIES: hypothetical protein [Parageobacillus]OXB93597.1 hypothetical protein B9L23_01015 [Parageobacillus galactosidasius]